MTQPTPTVAGQTVPDEESLAFEVAAVAAVTGAALGTVSALFATVGAAWTAGARGAEFGAELAARLRFLRVPAMGSALRRVSLDARVLGARRALARVSLPEVDLTPPESLPDPDKALADALVSAAALAEALPMEHKRDLYAVQGRANRGAALARGHARWVANEGINSGTADVARAAGQRLIWVAERNACLGCLAHAGHAVDPDEMFPILSFDPFRPTQYPAVKWPPLHPNCRCQVRVYDGPAGPPPRDRSLPDPAARLAAEARRSVVYQWSDYASGVRLRAAAAALLDAGADLPASVERRAESALRRGTIVKRP